MSTEPPGTATTVVIVMEPGWVYVKIADPRPEPDRIERLLHHTIDTWFHAHPKFAIDRCEAITNDGDMLGIHVWYHEESEPTSPSRPSLPPQDTLTIEIHGLIAEKFPKEYIEAVIGDALRIVPDDKNRHDTLVAINRRRVAVLLHRAARRGIVLPTELFEQILDPQKKAKLEAWFATPSHPFYVMHIAGNWIET
jgi:hypothetical protein